MIRCSAPLPEGLDNPVLEKMLEPAPCLVPSKEDEGGNKEGESASAKEVSRGEGTETSSPQESDTGDAMQPKGYPLAILDLEIPFATTLQGRPLLELGSPGEAFRSPSSPEEDPPKMSSAEKG